MYWTRTIQKTAKIYKFKKFSPCRGSNLLPHFYQPYPLSISPDCFYSFLSFNLCFLCQNLITYIRLVNLFISI